MLDTPEFIDLFEYNMKWILPKWGERSIDVSSEHDKGLSETIFSSSIVGDYVILNMSLSANDQALGTTPVTINTYDTGGLFALGEHAIQDKNPFSSFPIGDRQKGCTVGDVITLSISNHQAQVIGTRVLDPGNTQDGSAREPNEFAQGITARIILHHDKCDRIILSLEGKTGQEIRDFHISEGGFAGKTVASVKHSAIAPPLNFFDGSIKDSGFAPIISAVDMGDSFATTVLSVGVDYIWDTVNGTLYVNRDNLPESNLRLHFKGYVYDTRQTLYAEDVVNCRNQIRDALEGYANFGSITPLTQNAVLTLDNGINPPQGSIFITPKDSVQPPAGFDNWAFPDDGEILVEDLDGAYDGGDLEWRTGSPTTYIIGTQIGSVAHPFSDLIYESTFPIRAIPIPSRIHPDEIEVAIMDVSLKNGSIIHEFFLENLNTVPPFIDDTRTVDTDSIPITLIPAWYSESGGVISLTKIDDGLSVECSLTKIIIGLDTYQRGTCDITACVKAAINNVGSNGTLILIPYPSEAIPDSFDISGVSITEFVYSATVQYEAQEMDTSTGLPAITNIETWQIRFTDMQLSNLRIQLNMDGLKTSDWYAEDGGIAPAPDLTWVAPV